MFHQRRITYSRHDTLNCIEIKFSIAMDIKLAKQYKTTKVENNIRLEVNGGSGGYRHEGAGGYTP